MTMDVFMLLCPSTFKLYQFIQLCRALTWGAGLNEAVVEYATACQRFIYYMNY